jgi:hypothetical protein
MPLAYPVYRRYLSGTSRCTKTLSPRLNIAMAILFAFVATRHAILIAELLRSHKDFWGSGISGCKCDPLANHEH